MAMTAAPRPTGRGAGSGWGAPLSFDREGLTGPSAVGCCTEAAAAADGRREGADVMTRARLFWAGLLAAATTAVLVGGPAMVQAGITFNLLD